MNVLLIGHACGPGMGSEPGLTWNLAQNLCHEHRVYVITHPQFRAKVERWLSEHEATQIQFIWVDVESAWDPWNPAKGEKGIKIHYLMWLKRAYSAAQLLSETESIDVVHHISWGTLRAAPPMWDLKLPVIWGPLGGAQCAPRAFWRYFGWRAWKEAVRIISSELLRFSPNLKKAVGSAAVVFATNKETEKFLKRFPGARVQLMLDSALPSEWISDSPSDKRVSELFTLLWVGRLEHRKALALALQALKKAKTKRLRLVVAGDGPLRSKLERLTESLSLTDRVTFRGVVPYGEMQSLFRGSDALLFTSLRDAFGSVVLEGLAQGLPLITLNHQGVGTFVPDEAGIKVPVTTPSNTIDHLAAAIDELSNAPISSYQAMRAAAWTFAKDQTWAKRAKQMTRIYDMIVSQNVPDSKRMSISALMAEIDS